MRLVVDQAVRPDGQPVEYPHVAVPDSVRVLAVYCGRVAMVRQHVYLHGALTDLPGGMVDDGETPHDAAARELAEETGLTATWLHPLGTVVTARSVTTERVHLYLAHGCRPGSASLDAGEDLSVHWATWAEAIGELDPMAPASEPALGDAASLAAIQRTAVLLRRAGGEPPISRDHDVVQAARAAHMGVTTRDPILGDRPALVWLDVVIGRYAEGAGIVRDLEAALAKPGRSAAGERAWELAADRLATITQP